MNAGRYPVSLALYQMSKSKTSEAYAEEKAIKEKNIVEYRKRIENNQRIFEDEE